VTQLFGGSSKVALMDVNLSEDKVRADPDGNSYSPGAGGWPTVRYFNKKTGIKGDSYTKKTNGPMCEELGNLDYMVEYIEEYGNTFLCDVTRTDDSKGCTQREVEYIAKMKPKSGDELTAELERLESMDASSMENKLAAWLKDRKKILKQLVPAGGGSGGGSDEL